MPKITNAVGPTTTAVQLEEVEKWPGDSSLTSSMKKPNSDDLKNQPLPKPAPMTGSRSSKARKGNFTAPSTDTDPTASDN